MTFNEFIKAITPEQVTTWWDTISPTEAPEKVEEENWKYKLSKNGKTLPFKYTVSELALQYNLDFKSKDFSSNAANRDAFCEAFDFEVIEDLVYDNTEVTNFKEFYSKRVSNKNLFQSFLDYTNDVITKSQVNPYKIRMALTADRKKATIILGMRAVLQYTEENGNPIVGFILNNDFVASVKESEFDSIYPFKGSDTSKTFVTFQVNQWEDIQQKVLNNNLIAFQEQYDSIKNTKRVSWNTEANTTNSVLKYLVFKGEIVDEWINSTKKTRNHHIDFFTALEFEILNKSQGLICDRTKPEVNKYYDILKLAYEKLHYLTEIVQKEVFTKGKFNLLKKPTNQANYFQGYIWSKIYPSSKDNEDKWLAFTIGLDSDFHFNIKIDTVGLGDNDKKRIEYLNKRGDFYNSKIVNRPKSDEFNNWDDLIDYCINTIKNLESDYYDLKKSTALETKTQNKENNFPLNQILYGPPGTGKTYNTVLEAAKIVTGNEAISYTEALAVFKTNLDTQIEFITFHQNYSYEDFIQGLRPDIENGSALTFEKKDGVFKRIADRAYANSLMSGSSEKYKLSFQKVFHQFVEPLVNEEMTELPVLMLRGDNFYITNVSEKNIYFRKPSGGTGHDLVIKTLETMYNNETMGEFLALRSYYGPLLQKLLELGKSDVNKKSERKNYVIIIDEINRANISRVFGELITLIEEDKRSEGEIPMRVTLPSGDSFIVPSNLYIIGTMNTADKSIALLDVALRRRFEFKPMYPLYGGLEKPIHDTELLQKINDAILSRKNHDFTIGHAYFMGDNYSKEKTINNKVIPLLLEYFMNDEKEVVAILQVAGINIGGWPLKMI